MRLLMCLVVGLVVFLPVRGEAKTGNDLLGDCKAQLGSYNSVSCQGFIEGVISGYAAGIEFAFLLRSKPSAWQVERQKARIAVGYCLDGKTHGQIYDVVTKYLEQNPQTRHNPAAVLVHRALGNAFPCR